MRAIEKQAPLNAIQDKLLAGDGQFHTDHQAEAAHLFDEGELPRQIRELRAEISAHPLDGRQQLFENVEELQSHAARQSAATEGAAVHARLDGGGRLLIRHDHAQRNAACERFGRDHNVRQNYRFRPLVSEPRAGPADTALGFIGDQQGVVLISELPRAGCELVSQRINSAFALNHLQNDARSAAANGRFQRGHIVHGHDVHARQQRLEIGTVLWLAGHRERAERAPVEGVIQGYDFVLIRVQQMAVSARHLEAALHGFGSGIGEKSAFETADACQPLRQPTLKRMVIKIRRMDEEPGLLANGFDNARMGMPQCVDPDAGDEIEVTPALLVIHIAAPAAFDQQRITRVILEQEPAFQIDGGLGGRRLRHGRKGAGHFLIIQNRGEIPGIPCCRAPDGLTKVTFESSGSSGRIETWRRLLCPRKFARTCRLVSSMRKSSASMRSTPPLYPATRLRSRRTRKARATRCRKYFSAISSNAATGASSEILAPGCITYCATICWIATAE